MITSLQKAERRRWSNFKCAYYSQHSWFDARCRANLFCHVLEMRTWRELSRPISQFEGEAIYREERQFMIFGIPQMQIGWRGGNMKFTAFGFMQISLIEVHWWCWWCWWTEHHHQHACPSVRVSIIRKKKNNKYSNNKFIIIKGLTRTLNHCLISVPNLHVMDGFGRLLRWQQPSPSKYHSYCLVMVRLESQGGLLVLKTAEFFWDFHSAHFPTLEITATWSTQLRTDSEHTLTYSEHTQR